MIVDEFTLMALLFGAREFLLLVPLVLIVMALVLPAILGSGEDGAQVSRFGLWAGIALLLFLGFVVYLAFGRGLQEWLKGVVQ